MRNLYCSLFAEMFGLNRLSWSGSRRRVSRLVVFAAALLAFGFTRGFATPVIFNSTETATPGEVAYLQGDNFGSAPQVYFYVVQGNESPLSPPSSALASPAIKSASNTAITYQIPDQVPLGLYAVWVNNGGTYAGPVYINKARPMSFEYGEVSASYPFRIFGRNLAPTGSNPVVTFQGTDGSTPKATIVTNAPAGPNDNNILNVKAPASLVAGMTYTITVSNGYGAGTGGYDIGTCSQPLLGRTGGTDALGLNVPWAPDFAAILTHTIHVATDTSPNAHVTYASMVTTDSYGNANWINAIQQALYDASTTADGNSLNGGAVVLPAGTININITGIQATFPGSNSKTYTQPANTELYLPDDVVLEGSGSAVTSSTIMDDSNAAASAPRAIIFASNTVPYTPALIGLANFTYKQISTNGVSAAPNYPDPSIVPHSIDGSEYFASNLDIEFNGSNDGQGGSFNAGTAGSKDVLVQNCTINYGLFGIAGEIFAASYYNIRGNMFLHHGAWYKTRLEPGTATNMVFENNTATRDGSWPPPNAVNKTDPTDSGTVTSATGASLTDTSKNWTSNQWNQYTVTITGGTGAGQTAMVSHNSATQLYCSPNWTVRPDSTSTYSIKFIIIVYEQGGMEFGYSPNQVILNNTFNAVNLPLTYSNDGETIANQFQAVCSPDTGAVSSADSTSLTDSTAPTTHSWVPGGLIGQTVTITTGTDHGDARTIISNTSATMTCSTAWTTTPDTTSRYSVTRNAYDYGTVGSSSTYTTMTGTSTNPAGSGWPNGLAGDWVAIVSGTGAGQLRTITSNTSSTLNVSPQWDEIPTGGTYAITGPGTNQALVKGNKLSDQPRGIVFYTGNYDSVIADNILEDTGETIYLRGDQRPTLTYAIGGTNYTAFSGRFNPSWKTVVSNNVLVDTMPTSSSPWAAYGTSTFWTVPTSTGAVIGASDLGIEFRRNVQESYVPNKYDGSTSEYEGYAAHLALSSGTYSDPGFAALLASLFDDNVSINTTNAYTISTGAAQTTIWDSQVYPSTSALTNLITLSGGSAPVPVTGSTTNTCIFDAQFNGTGTSTGPGNMIDVGGTGVIQTGGGSTTTIQSSTLFDPLGGSYLDCNWLSGSGAAGSQIMVTPPSPRNSWGRIFDYRSGEWLINGAFDFFYRPGQDLSSFSAPGNIFQPLYLGNTSNGPFLILSNWGNNQFWLSISTPSSSTSGISLKSSTTYTPAITAGSIHHLGFVFSTDVTTLITTVKMFDVIGPGSYSTTSTTVGTGGLVAIGTFTMDATKITDNGGWLAGAPWGFGDHYTNSAKSAHNNDYEDFRLYYADPGTFPTLDAPAP